MKRVGSLPRHHHRSARRRGLVGAWQAMVDDPVLLCDCEPEHVCELCEPSPLTIDAG